MEPMRLERQPWEGRGIATGPYFSTQQILNDLNSINQAFMEAEDKLSGLYHMTGIGYTNQSATIQRACDNLQTVRDFVNKIPDEIDALDQSLFLGFNKGPAEALSHVNWETVIVPNDVQPSSTEAPYPELTFDEMMQGIQDVEGGSFFSDMLHDDYEQWKEANPDQDKDWDQYEYSLLRMGQYDHTIYQPFLTFVTNLLDFTIVWPIFKAITGYDPILQEALSESERLLGVAMALVDLASITIAVVSAGTASGGVMAGRAMLKAALRELIVNALATGASMLTYDLAIAMDLPPWVATLAAMGVGVMVSIKGTEMIITRNGAEVGRIDISDGAKGVNPPKIGETTPEIPPRVGIDDMDPRKPPKTPETSTPEAPKADLPEKPKTDVPKTPKTEVPEAPKTEVPKVKDAEVPETPKVEAPKAPETEISPVKDVEAQAVGQIDPITPSVSMLHPDWPILRDGSHVDPKTGKLKPNVRYSTGEHDYIYTTDANGYIESFHADELKNKLHADRLSHNSKTPGKLAGDQAGHLIADRFGGSPELDNLVSQLQDVNLKDFASIEREWAAGIKAGKKVTVDGRIMTDPITGRPTQFEVEYTIDGVYNSRIFVN